MNSLLMASYNDISTVPFWKGLEAGDPYTGYRPSCLEPGVPTVMPTMEFPATEQMVQIANRQVAEVHALPEIPLPYPPSTIPGTKIRTAAAGMNGRRTTTWTRSCAGCVSPSLSMTFTSSARRTPTARDGWKRRWIRLNRRCCGTFFGLKRPAWLKKGYALLANPCPGCGSLDGCVECKGADCAKALQSATPSRLDKVDVC